MKKKTNKNSNYSLAHVLYQKVGSDWYAFTEVDGDCFMSKVDPSIIDENAKKSSESSDGSKQFRTSNNRKPPRAA